MNDQFGKLPEFDSTIQSFETQLFLESMRKKPTMPVKEATVDKYQMNTVKEEPEEHDSSYPQKVAKPKFDF